MNMVSKCLEKCAKHDDRENLAIICCKMPERAKNARACAFEWFLVKCSIWLETCAKKNGNNLEHFKFLRARKRAHERVRADLRTFFDLKLTGRILILFMINMNEQLLSVMKIWSLVDFYKMAPGWRHDNFESLKSHALLSWTKIYHHWKFHDNGFCHSWDILRTKLRKNNNNFFYTDTK